VRAWAKQLFGAVLLGGAAVLLGLPGQAHGLTFELEGGRLTGPVRVVQDRAAVGGRAVALTGRGVVRHRVATTRRATAAVLRGRALPCTGRRPRIVLQLDGRAIGARAVPSRRFTRVRFRASAPAGPHTAALRLAAVEAEQRKKTDCLVEVLDDKADVDEVGDAGAMAVQ
jgi:hypothetical protein